MQQLANLSDSELNQRLAHEGLGLQVGPYIYKIKTNLPLVGSGISTLYKNFNLAQPEAFIDYNVAILSKGLLQRLRGQSDFLFDSTNPFDSIPTGQAYAFLEWGMNWCVSLHTNEYLKLHAAAVARGDHAIIMPGVPGAGKSTLCAALGLSGWRILSDEHAMIPPNTTEVVPLCRPVSLKNESIDVIKRFSSNAIFGPVSRETHKGVVAHMKADMHPQSHEMKTLQARTMVFPRYAKDETQRLSPRRRTESFILAAYHSFNYSLLCETGFEAMKTLIENVTCYDLVYHDLDWAVNAVDSLSDPEPNP
jgi:HprK-related kinase A|tara:strand:+ start:2980 stop:3900 length:921 start_codon:yes stop_codon:yes gene_type:complete